ncbi:MAG: hypothetical protein P8100_03835 [bacterium]
MITTSCALLFAIPVLLLLVTIVYVPLYVSRQNREVMNYLKEYLELTRDISHENRRKEMEKSRINLTLQAFERMMLFLERINPPNLLKRVMTPGLKATTLQSLLLSNIREEYEHNMSQQLYIKDETWELIKSAKEEVVSMINLTASKIEQEASAADFAKKLLTEEYAGGKRSIEKATKRLKQDLKDTF